MGIYSLLFILFFHKYIAKKRNKPIAIIINISPKRYTKDKEMSAASPKQVGSIALIPFIITA